MEDKLIPKTEVTIRQISNGYAVYRSRWDEESSRWIFIADSEMAFLDKLDLLTHIKGILGIEDHPLPHFYFEPDGLGHEENIWLTGSR